MCNCNKKTETKSLFFTTHMLLFLKVIINLEIYHNFSAKKIMLKNKFIEKYQNHFLILAKPTNKTEKEIQKQISTTQKRVKFLYLLRLIFLCALFQIAVNITFKLLPRLRMFYIIPRTFFSCHIVMPYDIFQIECILIT